MERILKYIETHICESLTNKQLAKIAGYSEYHFIRLFKEYTNMTCMHYIWKRRLIKASGDIANGFRIIDVAFQYGWHSHSHLKGNLASLHHFLEQCVWKLIVWEVVI